ncbi:DUF2459 domain-containing protein [Phormidium sp. CLA17]|uniref:DUF2459 domain-containing protein n=1 Tax=Leptolyngbya sp. Cla-17 TaxID=2803751 RepID=UPI001491B0F1|nr:DUF2459 domain-containing protein [Leptolyngbya sp. Cla-17]MBM0743244.1 DUF2459 domain-containing protein [Leptolyngbya sp. Cla-17]
MNCKDILRKGLVYLGAGALASSLAVAIAVLTPRKWSFEQREPCEFTVYLSSDGFHTNLFVPTKTVVYDWTRLTSGIANEFSMGDRYIQFGWGDLRFYMETPNWNQVNPLEGLRALFFWQNSTTLFVKGHAALPHTPNEDLKCVRLGKTDYLAMMTFIDRSFQTNPQGQKQRLGSGQDQQSGFYAATGYYSLLNTCNSWTANALRAANVNTPLWGGLAQPIMMHLQNGCTCDVNK